MVLVHVMCASAAEAEAIAESMLVSRLAACATLGPEVRSRYRWQGGIESAAEVPLLLKTRRHCFAELERAIRRLHSYQVPEIVAVSVVEGSAAYLDWLAGETGHH
ncbi:MAG: divalent-cation tolerance protein CutA [Terriglobales bacterium]